MRKRTLASLAALLISAGGASADPWGSAVTSQYAPVQQPVAQQSARYPAPAYPSISSSVYGWDAQMTGNFGPAQVSHQYMQPSYAQPPVVSSCPTGNCGSERYGSPMMAQPAPMSYGAPCEQSYINPSYVNDGYPPCGTATCGVAAPRSYTLNVRGELLFLNRIDTFNDSRLILDGPNPLTLNDTAGDGSSTAYRIGADLLFGDPCSDWQHGVGFVYGNYGSFDTSRSGELPLGIAFDANTKNVPGFVNTSCFFLDQTTFFASVARAASSNSDQTNEQEELEGLGPDPLPGSGSETFALPTYRVDYNSDLDSIGVDFVMARRAKRLRLAVGWRQWNLTESSFVGITGPLHATDLSFANGLPRRPDTINNGIEHNAFVYAGTGNGSEAGFTYIGPPGAEDGLDGQNVDGTGAAVDNNGLTDGVGPDLVELLSAQRASNTLNGINFAVAGDLFYMNRFDVFGLLNLGVYHNSASGTVAERVTELTGNGSAYGRGFTDSADVVSFVGSAALEGGYWVTDWARLYGGYEVIFINGVALSPEQESGLSGNSYMLKHDGDLILHGAKVGVEFLY